jgi:hypothetical protein
MIGYLKWWLVFLCSLSGLCLAVAGGYIGIMWRLDAYKISFVTLTTYFVVTVFIGRLTWRLSAGDRKAHLRYQEGCDYAVTLMTMLGLIGTVVGFMELLSTSFASLASADMVMAQKSISALTAGSSTALINTLVGLIGAVGLKLQVVNLNLAASHV